MARARMRLIDLLAGIVTMVVVIAFWSQRDYTTPMGGHFPDAILYSMSVGAALLVARALLGRGQRGLAEKVMPIGVVRAYVVLVAWIYLLPRLGFLIGSFIFFLITAVWIRGLPLRARAIAMDATISALLVGVVYAFFSSVLRVRLPEGLFLA
jgi:hypothetical protein